MEEDYTKRVRSETRKIDEGKLGRKVLNKSSNHLKITFLFPRPSLDPHKLANEHRENYDSSSVYEAKRDTDAIDATFPFE
jgi:hypothetical protein